MTVCRAASIVIDSDHLEYFGPEGAHWRVPISHIRALGEYRIPGSEDSHYLAALIDDSGAWFQAPVRASGMEPVLSSLSARLGSTLRLKLSSADSYTSRVLWPPHVEGEPLFDFGADGRVCVTSHLIEVTK
jgi:hypothetical protein